jgi:hypothetical protein
MKKILAIAAVLLFSALSLRAQTATTTITIVAPASLGTITPTPSHFYQNLAAPISFASSGTGFNGGCTATVGTTSPVALPVTYVSPNLTATLTAAMTNVAVGSSLTITITCTPSPLTLNTPVVLPNGKVGANYSTSLVADTGISGGVPPYTWTVNSGSLPAGLALSSSSGLITGTPSSSGSSTIGFLVTDSSGAALLFKPGAFDYLSFRTRDAASRLRS